MSGRTKGACCAYAGKGRKRTINKSAFFMMHSSCTRIWLWSLLVCKGIVLFQPKLHQHNFGLLVSDDLLRQSAHLRILAMQELRLSHVDGRLVVRKHQSDKINIAVAGPLN